MSIMDYITRNGGFISSADAKKASLYNELLDGTRNGSRHWCLVVCCAYTRHGRITN